MTTRIEQLARIHKELLGILDDATARNVFLQKFTRSELVNVPLWADIPDDVVVASIGQIIRLCLNEGHSIHDLLRATPPADAVKVTCIPALPVIWVREKGINKNAPEILVAMVRPADGKLNGNVVLITGVIIHESALIDDYLWSPDRVNWHNFEALQPEQ